MGGINAILNRNGRIYEEDIRLMSSAIVHRGPDEAGFIINKNKNVALSSLRLGTIDLKNGHQPMYNEDNSIVIVFNGEIYDVKMHREFLISRGHCVKTNSDTEIMIHLYEEYGIDFLDRINGEFAFIIWDENKKKMYAARDRFGIKPLYYNVSSGEILMSSEIKGILALDRMKKEFSIEHILSACMGIHSKTHSIIEDIKSIRPAHFLEIDGNGKVNEHQYWKINFTTDNSIGFNEAKDGVRELLEKAIKRRIIADVPIGLYLSGGIDSTLLCGVMAKYNKNIKAFNIGFAENTFDESEFARLTAKYYDVDFINTKCTMDMMAEKLEKTIYHSEAIITNPHCVARNILSERANKSGYNVCLTGEGSDEFFLGYPYFRLEYIWRQLLEKGEDSDLTTLRKNFYKSEHASEYFMWDREDISRDKNSFLKYPNYFYHRANGSHGLLVEFFNKERFKEGLNTSLEDIFRKNFDLEYIKTLDPINSSKYISLNLLYSYIIPLLGDRAEMANSVEGRLPFLDRDLIEFISKLPSEYLLKTVNGFNEKYVLKEAFENIIPPHMKNRKKHAFLSPSWGDLLKTKYGQELREEFLSDGALKESNIFDLKELNLDMLSKDAFPEGDFRRKKYDLFMGMILSLQILHKKFVKSKIITDSEFNIIDRSI